MLLIYEAILTITQKHLAAMPDKYDVVVYGVKSAH
jgi:hypothetical protein